jgi:hypothetical protein
MFRQIAQDGKSFRAQGDDFTFTPQLLVGDIELKGRKEDAAFACHHQEALPYHSLARQMHCSDAELRYLNERGRVATMSELDPVKKIIAPFLIHGICKSEAEALHMLAKDYVQRQVKRYDERAEHFRSVYHTSVEQFAQQVADLCDGTAQIPALTHLARHEQLMRAEDDLEEWQAAEEFLARWRALEADLQHKEVLSFPCR